MNKNMLFEFEVNKETSTINIVREFSAPLDLVWDAWTKPEILEKWWAPKPYTVESIFMNFSVGGHWHYAMVNPEGEKHYCKANYTEIEEQKMFSYSDAFCDEAGNDLTTMPSTHWQNTFVEENEQKTLVKILLSYETTEALEAILSMGMKEGFTMALENLDQYLEAQFKLMKQKKQSKEARTSTYLNFDGKTEEAFNFYKLVFRSDFVQGIQRFEDIPQEAGHPPIAEEIKRMVLHVQLPILGGHILMGTDAPKEMGFSLMSGNSMHICLEPDSREEAKRLFDELAKGGTVSMPLEDMFFGAYYGELKDKFGVNWMINFINK